MRFKSERFCYWQDTFGENESDTVFSLTPYSPRTVWSLSALTIITKPYNFWPSWSSYVCECYLRPCPLSAWRKFATPLLDMQCWWQCYCFCLLVAELWGEATASLLSFGKVLYMHSRSPSSRWCILSSLFCGNIVHFGLVAWVWKGVALKNETGLRSKAGKPLKLPPTFLHCIYFVLYIFFMVLFIFLLFYFGRTHQRWALPWAKPVYLRVKPAAALGIWMVLTFYAIFIML